MTETDLAARYGTRPAWQRWAVRGVVGAVVVALLALFVPVLLSLADPEVSSDGLVFDDSTATDRAISAEFVVDMADDVEEATCTLNAYGTDRTIVGSVTFVVPQGTTRVERTIATERRAVRVELVGCTAPGQSRPR